MDIKITITNKRCTVEGDPVIVCGNKVGYTMTFTFDEEWTQAGKKTARFTWIQKGARQHRDVDLVDDTVTVPAVYKTNELRVGVYAGDLESTAPARIRCEKSILCDTCAPNDYEDGKQAGKQAEYDRFWDTYQEKGKRTDYNIYAGSFAGRYWTDELFNPKYPIIPTNAEQMFRSTGITDLTQHAAKLDFSKATNMNYTFAYGGILKKLPVIDMSSATSTTSTFAEYMGESLSLIVGEQNNLSSSTFNYCTNLVNLTISGTIGKSITLKDSPLLTLESVQSIIDHLKDLTGATAQTLTLHATVGAKLAQAQKDAITAKNWTLVY